MAWRVGVDSGGTFTDVCLFNDETGRIDIWKVPSTPDDPSRGIAQGVEEGLNEVGAASPEVEFLGHGTTVATNALIEHRGVKTGLIVTDGFRDLLEIGRQKRPSLYDMNVDKPEDLVTRDLRIQVVERMRSDGSIERPLDLEGVRKAARAFREADVKAVAICFLYGFLNPAHEVAARRVVEEELPGVFVSVSHEVAPEFREFERLSTATVNAYLGPVMKRYIQRLQMRFKDLGLGVTPNLTQSNGGVIGFEAASELPVRTVLSGPSTGVVAAQAIGRMAGYENLITFDMGGTSSDVALLQGGACKLTGEASVHGYPIKAPMLDIHTVGAGGGSIATIDSGGLLKVGPRSAGAHPGPVAYGNGGTEPAVTDANVVLQTLNPTEILGGRMKVHRELAVEAMARLATPLGMEVMEVAQGILSVVTANMAKAIRVISVQRGYDPRDYTLMAFGGAGPLHAARLAKELDIKRILVPRTPGALCALGLLLTDLRADFAITRLLPLEVGTAPAVKEGFASLEAQAEHWFESEKIDNNRRIITRTADMRYRGQNYELSVPLPHGPINAETLDTLAAGFSAAHKQRYGFVAEEEPVQLVTLRLEAAGLVQKAEFASEDDAGPSAEVAQIGTREVYFPEYGKMIDCPVYSRERLRAGNCFHGPAIVEQMDTTTVVLPDMIARVDRYQNLVLETN